MIFFFFKSLAIMAFLLLCMKNAAAGTSVWQRTSVSNYALTDFSIRQVLQTATCSAHGNKRGSGYYGGGCLF